MKFILSHPTGNANVRAALKGFNSAGLLKQFHTAIASFPGSFLDRLSNSKVFDEIKRRNFDPALKSVTYTHPMYEACRIIATKVGLQQLVKQESGIFSIDSVYRHLDKTVAKVLIKNYPKDINGVYAYEDGALSSFKAAKKLGLKCYYDLPIGYWKTSRQLLENEKNKWPDWAVTLTGLQDSAYKLLQKDEELKLADHIFVASTFTANSLKNFEGKLAPVTIIPYGFPTVATDRTYSSKFKEPLKILFVGGLSQRKGIAELFAAVNTFKKKVSLTIVGKKLAVDCEVLNEELQKHRWIPGLPHQEILTLMQQNDVLVFPSLFEGYGLVISEAMSQGTPVITTDRTAGPDIIKDGENGWLIEAGSATALIAAIENILGNRECLATVGKAAMETAKARTWTNYGNELTQALLNSINC